VPDADDLRDAQRVAWDALADGWDRWERVIHDQLAPVTDALLELVGPHGGGSYLDVASGTGEPGLTLAERVPDAYVTVTDLSPAMLRVARRRADERGLTNVVTQVCSADDLPFDDGVFDGVTVRFGYMFLPDLGAASAELIRVLRPGGRLSASVWVEPDANPWTSVALDVIAAEVGLPPATPDGPGMYRCAAPGAMADLLRAAGCEDVTERVVDVELVAATPDEYWDVVSGHVSSAVAALAGVDATTRARIGRTVAGAIAPYVRDDAVRVPGRAGPGARRGRAP
jgi:ubiquinone/menaquinone biosynthesis C-methylase UbiE